MANLYVTIDSGAPIITHHLQSHQDLDSSSLISIDVLTRLRHPSILRGRNLRGDRTGIYIDVPTGRWTLSTAIESNLLSSSETVDLMWKLIDAMSFLHRHDYVHPGMATSQIILRGSGHRFRPILTEVGSIRRRIDPADISVDVEALGYIFLEMVSGKSKRDIVSSLDSTSPTRLLESLNSMIKPGFADAVDMIFRMIQDVPSLRPTIPDLIDAGFFTGRGDRPRIYGSAHETTGSPSIDPFEYCLETTSSSVCRQAECLYSRLSVHNPILMWVCVFITAKLTRNTDGGMTNSIDDWSNRSGIDVDLLQQLEIGVILDVHGWIGCSD